MKKLIITLEYPPQIGGIANYLLNYSAAEPVDSVVVLAPSADGDKDFDAKHPWKVYRRNLFISWLWPHWIRLFFQAWDLVRKEGISALDVHHILPVGYVAYLLKKFKKIHGYAVFLHGTDVALAIRDNHKKKWFIKICGNADKVVVNSQFLADKVREYVGHADIRVVHPCPADYFLQPVAPEIKEHFLTHLALQGKKVIITVARMVDAKGYPHIVKLLPQILQRYPNVVWLIVGDGPKKAEIISFIQKNNLQNNVRFLGTVPNEHLPALYQTADIFLLLTHPDNGIEEGWGTVFLEASASGLPVIAGRSGGVEEAVQDGTTGYVVDTYQDNIILEHVVHLLERPDLAKTMGQAGRARVEQEFTWKKQLSHL